MIRRHRGAPVHSETQIKLLETFADQAVIAIENVRLFKELQERNRDLTEAWSSRPRPAEILRVISQLANDLQPVFEAIARERRSAVRGDDSPLCTGSMVK